MRVWCCPLTSALFYHGCAKDYESGGLTPFILGVGFAAGALFEFGEEAVRRDNICKTQCSFALNAPSGNSLLFDPSSDQLQAPLPFSHSARSPSPQV